MLHHLIPDDTSEMCCNYISNDGKHVFRWNMKIYQGFGLLFAGQTEFRLEKMRILELTDFEHGQMNGVQQPSSHVFEVTKRVGNIISVSETLTIYEMDQNR